MDTVEHDVRLVLPAIATMKSTTTNVVRVDDLHGTNSLSSMIRRNGAVRDGVVAHRGARARIALDLSAVEAAYFPDQQQ